MKKRKETKGKKRKIFTVGDNEIAVVVGDFLANIDSLFGALIFIPLLLLDNDFWTLTIALLFFLMLLKSEEKLIYIEGFLRI